MFNINYAYTKAYYPKTIFAQSRGMFRRGGHSGSSFGSRNGFFSGGSINHPQRVINGGGFRNGYGKGKYFR